MIWITHTTPRRLLSHLRKLTRDGESLLSRPPFLSPVDEALWDVRVWRCLHKVAGRDAFEGSMELDLADSGIPNLLDFKRPTRSVTEVDELLRRRIQRRLVTLAGVIEKVEAVSESS